MVALRPGRLLRTRFVTLIGRPAAGNVLQFNNAGNCLAAAPVLDALVHANGHYYTKSPRWSASSGQRRLNRSRSSRGSPARSRVLRAALRERFNKTAGGGRRVEKQHAGGFAAAFLPRMWEIARHERAGAGPAYDHLIPIFKVISPASTQATSSLSRCRWKRLVVPAAGLPRTS